MADIVIDGVISTALGWKTRMGPVWTSTAIGYIFYIEINGDFGYVKTVDSGATWGTFQVESSAGTVRRGSVWFDKWTPSDSGTVIHLCLSEDVGGTNTLYYDSLDTSDDSFSGQVQIDSAGVSITGYIDICKAEGGDLYFVTNKAPVSGGIVFRKSTDSGASWGSALANSGSTISTAASEGRLIPANTDDTNDVGFVHLRQSTGVFSYAEYDQSGNSWSNITLGTITVALDTSFEASIRHSDKHVIAVLGDDQGSGAVDDILVWDVTDVGTVTAKTNPVTDVNTLEKTVLIAVDQNTDDLYVIYAYGSGAATWFYKKSTDGGASWETETALSESTYSQLNYSGVSISIGPEEGRIQVVWENGSGPPTLNTNAAISVAIEAAAVAEIVQTLSGSLEIDGYEPFFGGGEINIVLDLNIKEWKQVHTTGAILLNITGGQNQALALDTAEVIITVSGVVARLHAVHPITTDEAHTADFIDLEEAALLWNRLTPKNRARLRHALLSGDRLYEGVIRQLVLVDNPGTELIDFILTFEVAWNKSRPALREWN